jgi:hypothetical protein
VGIVLRLSVGRLVRGRCGFGRCMRTGRMPGLIGCFLYVMGELVEQEILQLQTINLFSGNVSNIQTHYIASLATLPLFSTTSAN